MSSSLEPPVTGKGTLFKHLVGQDQWSWVDGCQSTGSHSLQLMPLEGIHLVVEMIGVPASERLLG